MPSALESCTSMSAGVRSHFWMRSVSTGSYMVDEWLVRQLLANIGVSKDSLMAT